MSPTPAPIAMDATTPTPTGLTRSALGPLITIKPAATATVIAINMGCSILARDEGAVERCTTYNMIQYTTAAETAPIIGDATHAIRVRAMAATPSEPGP